MKTLFIECNMGAAGDMLSAALLELLPNPQGFVERLNQLGIPGVQYRAESVVKSGITGMRMQVLIHGQEEEHCHHDHEHHHEHCGEHPHEHHHEHAHHHEHHHHHSSMAEIEAIVTGLHLPGKAEADVLEVYRCIAEAESKVHGVSTAEIHFHEVGTMDAVADITAVCMLMNELQPEQVVVSPIRVGSGMVKCAHGLLPVPAPATAQILMGMPVYAGDIPGEMCTPTGAALLKHFADHFGNLPAMKMEAVGYGMGTRDFGGVNCVRAILGQSV